MGTEAEDFLGLSPDNDPGSSQKQRRCKPIFYRVAIFLNLAAIITIIWLFTGFEGRSGMEGMFDSLLPLLGVCALTGVGFLSNIIGAIRGEPVSILTGVNLILSIFAVIYILSIL